MKIKLGHESVRYARIVFDVIRIFLPSLSWQDLTAGDRQEYILDFSLSPDKITVYLNKQPMVEEKLAAQDENETKRTMKLAAYRFFTEKLNYEGSPWGILTGIRPTKIVHRLWDKGIPSQTVTDLLRVKYLVAPDKIEKLINITLLQRPYLYPEKTNNTVGIYIGIPFCPTRCSYCSFLSYSLTKWGRYLEVYLQSLAEEINVVGAALHQSNTKVQTIYIGGGTPTSLNKKMLAGLLSVVAENLYMPETIEFTVEAGRPDTIDDEKLLLMREFLVDRVSINPQTMWQPTLDKIGREHSVADVVEKVCIARNMGFKVINMDLIIGLPGENYAIMEHTLRAIENVMPENLTIHSLALKRASKLKEESADCALPSDAGEMFSLTEKWCREKGYLPYYLYRQKQIIGNMENVGYCQPGTPCLYNIQMMEERQTIWGLGLGAGSKIVNSDLTLENIYNPKDLIHYNENFSGFLKTKVDKILGLS
ncbi:MAG: coproporphyrinogen dehydrogenase HemZ [Bacillota bacterium]